MPRTRIPLISEQIASAHERLIHLMDRYERSLYRFLLVLAGDCDLAGECTQEAFVRAFGNLQKGKPVNARWLYTVGRNLVMDEYRRKRWVPYDLEVLQHEEDPGAASPEGSIAMREAFAHLSPDDRAILYLSAVEGLDGDELAHTLGVGRGAVRMRLCRARERFRMAYGGTR